jgi:hypothetical protein
MEDEVCGCVVEDLLKQGDFASKKQVSEIGRPTTFLTTVVKQSKNGLIPFFLILGTKLNIKTQKTSELL